MKYLLYNGKTVTGEGVTEAAVLIEGEKIAEITPSDKLDEDFLSHYADARAIDLKGRFIFAGGIDAHVHFREPGMTHKADIGTESKAAVKGGITSFICRTLNLRQSLPGLWRKKSHWPKAGLSPITDSI